MWRNVYTKDWDLCKKPHIMRWLQTIDYKPDSTSWFDRKHGQFVRCFVHLILSLLIWPVKKLFELYLLLNQNYLLVEWNAVLQSYVYDVYLWVDILYWFCYLIRHIKCLFYANLKFCLSLFFMVLCLFVAINI